ncbi:MAG: hypothetical protein KDH20_08640 [Rhodocyclaceae bacterium]|nr:hypothetical protein [Rhodocyclaceae bacterium]
MNLTFLIILAGFVALALWLVSLLRSVGRPAAPASAPFDWQDCPYRCVSIRRPGRSCEAVRALAGKRYLPDEAPRLPLETCDEAFCSCGFRRHRDRRSHDRRNAFDPRTTCWTADQDERRSLRRGRRRED